MSARCAAEPQSRRANPSPTARDSFSLIKMNEIPVCLQMIALITRKAKCTTSLISKYNLCGVVESNACTRAADRARNKWKKTKTKKRLSRLFLPSLLLRGYF